MNPVNQRTRQPALVLTRKVVLDGPGRELRAAAQVQLVEYPRDVRLGSPLGNRQLVSDLAIGQPAREECGHFLFASREKMSGVYCCRGSTTVCASHRPRLVTKIG